MYIIRHRGYTGAHITLLNQLGRLSNVLLQMKFKIDYEYAKEILESIVNEYENVRFVSQNIICIDGIGMPIVQKRKIQKQKEKRKSKWKDVSKP